MRTIIAEVTEKNAMLSELGIMDGPGQRQVWSGANSEKACEEEET
jgi:hypothetical protein